MRGVKALRFFEPNRVAVTDVPDPHAGPGEAVVRLHATGLCNSDVRVYLGEKKAAAGVVPGHEMSGEVVEAGEGANARVGEIVAICPIRCCGVCSFCREGFRNRCPNRKTLGYDLDGGIAEYVKVPAPMPVLGHLLPMDPATPPHLRAFVEPLACVLNSLEELGVRSGAPFAVVGGGPMGLVHLIAGQAYGAGPILVVEPEAERRAVAKELGADAVCTPEEAPALAKDLTGGEGFPSIAMAVGFAEAVPACIAITRKLGRINFFAGFPPGSMHQLDLNQLHYDEVKLFGTQNAPFHLYHRAAQMAGRLPKIDRVITNRYSLDQAAEAYSARLGKQGLKSAVIMV
jgi:L-iditol 2-dehydrogenase